VVDRFFDPLTKLFRVFRGGGAVQIVE
jgi:hypothetical protein